MKRNIYSHVRLIPLILAACPATVLGVVGCFVYGPYYSCCNTYYIPCDKDGEEWLCPQLSTVTGWSVRVARTTPQGETGKTIHDSVLRGSCTMTPTKCGNTPGACDVQNDKIVLCQDANITGASCP